MLIYFYGFVFRSATGAKKAAVRLANLPDSRFCFALTKSLLSQDTKKIKNQKRRKAMKKLEKQQKCTMNDNDS